MRRRSAALEVKFYKFTIAVTILSSVETTSTNFSNWEADLDKLAFRLDSYPGDYSYLIWNTKNGCPLDVRGTHPYLVKICSKDNEAFSRNGAIFSHLGVLTTAKGKEIKEGDFVVGQRVFSMRHLWQKLVDSCNQLRSVAKFIVHPKYDENDYDQTFNYAIITLDRQYDASPDFAYPTLPILKGPYEYSQFLRRIVTIQQDHDGCELPRTEFHSDIATAITWTKKATIRMNGDECTKLFCDSSSDPNKCTQERKAARSYTLICVFYDNKAIEDDYALLLGSPLICNGTAVGLAGFYTPGKEVLTVPTFLKIWPWLMTYKDMLWNKTWNRKEWDSVFIDKHLVFFDYIRRRKISKNVTLSKKKIKFIKRVRRISSNGNLLKYSYAFYRIVALLTILKFHV